MAKINTTDISSLTSNEQSAIALLNANFNEIDTKSDSFLSRDGTAPNQMTADLDMNSKKIMNLPAAASNTEPIRKAEHDADLAANLVAVNASASAAATSATQAAASAASALEAASDLSGTSTTNLTIGSGSKTFTTQSGKSFEVGRYLLIVADSDTTQWMFGQVTTYSGTTLIVNVTANAGSGTFSAWSIYVAGVQGVGSVSGPVTTIVNDIALWNSTTGTVLKGATLTDGTTIDFTYNSGPGTITAERAALTGDITASAGSNTTTLATVNANVGTFGSATQSSQVTVNAKGLTTAASNVAIAIPSTQVTDFTEAAQDAVGTALTDTATIDLTYTDASNTITADVINDSITFAKIQNITSDRLLGRDTALSGDPEEISLNSTLEFTGAGAIQRAALTGDVTASAGSNTTTIPNDTVTYAKMQNAGAYTILGRNAGTSGDLADIDISTVTEKTTLAANDLFLIQDSAASNAFKRVKWSNVDVGGGGGGRELLTANRTYYVRTDGSDTNNGLTNTAGGAFLTIQKAVDTVADTLDLGGKNITIQVGDGTYTGAVTLKNAVGFPGAGGLTIQGNSTTPANVVISTTSNDCFRANQLFVIWDIKDLKMQTTTGGSCLYATNATLRFGNVDFGATATYHIRTAAGAQILCTASYSVTGGATRHVASEYQSYVEIIGFTVTVSSSLAWTHFCVCTMAGMADFSITTISGGASNTGTRYNSTTNGIINTNGGGANYFPGNAAGTTATQGQYL